MKRYRVIFNNKKDHTYQALSYSEDADKYYFHQKEDRSDKDSFAFKKDVMGIDTLPSMFVPQSV
jgi:hypothetical protein